LTVRLSAKGGTQIEFRPSGQEAKIYICGVTPYDACHLGHVATFLTYDVLVRRLHELGYRTRVIRNITDLDEPILPRAQKLGVPYPELVESEVEQLGRDLRNLDMLAPDCEPRVSQMLDEVREFIEDLAGAGYTYQINGTTYFEVGRSDVFGSLSGYSQELRLHYARERGGDPDSGSKRGRLDFVLWRPARDGEPVYDSRLGPGVPGWHIGCSAMARALLGATVDLHGGGADLIFPHHECEQAQTMAVQEEPFVGTWHHCQLVRYRGEKMSKSLGNIVLARDLLTRHDPRAVRLALLRLYRYTAGFEWRGRDIVPGERLLDLVLTAGKATGGPDPRRWADTVRAAIDDDLDFPTAVAELEDFARAVLAGGTDPAAPTILGELAALLGVDLTRPMGVIP
jgi:L-cysteine:1D-myo-inositol 2-amino-2-deoxy-alpha-D-glucopyranoside ligase